MLGAALRAISRGAMRGVGMGAGSRSAPRGATFRPARPLHRRCIATAGDALPPELNQDLNLSREALVFIDEGDKHLQRGEVAVAIEKYEKVITTHRYHPTAYARRGDARAQQGNYHEAIDDYKRVLLMVPGNVPSLCSIATCRIQMGELDEALTLLDQCIYLDPSYTRASLERGRLKVRLNKLEESIADFVRVREKVAGDLDAGVSLAAVYLHLGRIAEARTVYEDILKRDVRNFRALAGLNIIAFGEERHDDAVAYAEAALQSPQVPGPLERSDLLVKKASSVLGMGRVDEAWACVQEAIQLFPDNHVARFVRYQIHMHHGRYQKAVDDITFFIEASEKRFDFNSATPEAIATFRNTRSRMLIDRGKCALHLFLQSHPNVMVTLPKLRGTVKGRKPPVEQATSVNKAFVEDLLYRVKVSGEAVLIRMLEDFLLARSESQRAKHEIDPLLHTLKATVNEHLRQQ